MPKDDKLESTIQKAIIKYLKGRGGEVLNFHGGAFQTPGIPDLYYTERSLGSMWFEVKRPGEPHPVTKLQALQFDRLEAQDTPVFVVHSVEEVVMCIDYMEHICLPQDGCLICDAYEIFRWRYRKEVNPSGGDR